MARKPTKDTTQRDEDALARFKAAWGPAEDYHQRRCRAYRSHWRAYLNTLHNAADERVAEGKRSDSLPRLRYRHNIRPKHVLMTVELLLANLLDEHPKGRVVPCTPEDIRGAKAHEKLLAHQREQDSRDDKLVRFTKGTLIHGIGGAKVSFDYETGPKTNFQWHYDPVAGKPYRVADVTDEAVLCNRPTFEPWPAEDLLWDPGARSPDQVAYVLARAWVTLEHLKQMERDGVYRNIADVAQNDAQSGRQSSGVPEDGYSNVDRRGRIEVVEFWTRDRLITVAGGVTVIRDEPNPFAHHQIPFVFATTMPSLNDMQGLSEAGIIADLQSALTDNLNQRLDNADHLLAGTYWYNPTLASPDQITKFTGAAIPRENANAWGMDNPPTNIITASIQNDEPILALMRDISGAVAYVSGAGQDTLDQKTATGISIIQSMAGQRFRHKKGHFSRAFARAGWLEVQLNQQFIHAPEFLPVQIRDGYDHEVVMPQQLAGEYRYHIEDVEESINQQQRRAEANEKLDRAMALYQIAAADPNVGFVPNLEEGYRDWLETYGELETDKYVQKRAPLMPVVATGGPAGMGAPAGLPAPPGMTPALAAPPGAPALPPGFPAAA